MTQKNCFVIGARGYSGLQLCSLIESHPNLKLKGAFATDSFSLSDYGIESKVPGLPMSEIQNFAPPEFVFTATPVDVSWKWAPYFIEKSSRVIDISGAFRLKGKNDVETKSIYNEWYKESPTDVSLFSKVHYGLIPWFKPDADKVLISNPGCYATAALMALSPLVHNELIEVDSIFIDGKSGSTGAGKKTSENLLHAEVAEGCTPYRVKNHQHIPEIQQALAGLTYKSPKNWQDFDITFVPHLLNIRRGIIVSVYTKRKATTSDSMIHEAFKIYENYPLADVVCLDESHKGTQEKLNLRNVSGTAKTVVAYSIRKHHVLVFALIDNLLKGAASQAIENLNLILDLPVETGLSELRSMI